MTEEPLISTLEPVTKELKRFLTSKEDENIVLTGAWGTGKTQAWKRAVFTVGKKALLWQRMSIILFGLFILFAGLSFFKDNLQLPVDWSYFIFVLFLGSIIFTVCCVCNRNRLFPYQKYAYVSAVDCEKLKDLEEKILHSTVGIWNAGKEATPFDDFKRKFIRPILWIVMYSFSLFIPITFFLGVIIYAFSSSVRSYVDNGSFSFEKLHECLNSLTGVESMILGTVVVYISTLIFKYVQSNEDYGVLRNNLICIDDIERASKKLEPQEILNLAANLKENKNCKVALILNENEFYDEKENSEEEREAQKKSLNKKQEKWKKALEKGSDAHLVLRLDAKSAAELAFGDKNEEESKKRDQNDPLVKVLRSQVKALAINNVRIIQHIWTDLKRWTDLVEKVTKDHDVLEVELYERLAKYTALFGVYYYEFEDKKRFTLLAWKKGFTWNEIHKEDYFQQLWEFPKKCGFQQEELFNRNRLAPLARHALGNIEKGYLLDVSGLAEYYLALYAIQLSSAEISKLVDRPWSLLETERHPALLIKKALLAIPLKLEKVRHIGFGDANMLLYLAGKVKKTGDNEISQWEKKFKELYIKSLNGRDPNFFKNGLPFLPKGIQIDLDLKLEFERISRGSKEHRYPPHEILDDILSGLNSDQGQIFYKDFEYEDWNESSLKEKLAKYTPPEICKLAFSFFYSSALENHSSEISIYAYYREKRIFPADWPGFLAFKKLGSLLYSIFKDYWDTEEIMNPALGEALEAYPWQELIDLKVPETNE